METRKTWTSEAKELYSSRFSKLVGYLHGIYDAETAFSRFMPLAENGARNRIDSVRPLIRRSSEIIEKNLSPENQIAWLQQTSETLDKICNDTNNDNIKELYLSAKSIASQQLQLLTRKQQNGI